MNQIHGVQASESEIFNNMHSIEKISFILNCIQLFVLLIPVILFTYFFIVHTYKNKKIKKETERKRKNEMSKM